MTLRRALRERMTAAGNAEAQARAAGNHVLAELWRDEYLWCADQHHQAWHRAMVYAATKATAHAALASR